MTPSENVIYDWPRLPLLPPVHGAVLVRVATGPDRQAARRELRAALRQVLASWSGLLPDELPLSEGLCGPIWSRTLAGHSLDISLSYCENAALMGLYRGGAIGVDAMPITPIAEADEVARHYLGPVALAEIQQSENPARTFAVAWTSLEARLKCLKLKLTEWNADRDAALRAPAVQSSDLNDGGIVSVATAAALADDFAVL